MLSILRAQLYKRNLERLSPGIVEEVLTYQAERLEELEKAVEDLMTEISQVKEDLSEARF